LKLRPYTRLLHSLAIPYNHQPLTKFENGIPKTLVRPLVQNERKWDFWTSSDAFYAEKPSFFGFTHIPFGEIWVFKSGKVLNAGFHFITPFVSKLHAVKTEHPILMGIVTQTVNTKDGNNVNGYVVATIQVTDYAKSALYLDPETNRYDSERVVARFLRKRLEEELNNFSGKELDSSTKSKLNSKLVDALRAKEGEFGLKVLDIDVRGAYDSSINLADKLRALDPPPVDENAAGHNLSNDYWADRLTPPFFEKNRFGSNKEIKTPAAVSLEWCIPSPPDYHHFNMIPKMTAASDGEPVKH
ncbi:hypothetical protein HK099_001457, partial [Clydaea vesicula]